MLPKRRAEKALGRKISQVSFNQAAFYVENCVGTRVNERSPIMVIKAVIRRIKFNEAKEKSYAEACYIHR